MLSHPILLKRFIRLQMIAVVTLVLLGALYSASLWTNTSSLLPVLDPAISILATVVFFGLFLVPVVWIVARIVVRVLSRKPVAVELKERLQRLAVETLRRMRVNPGSSRFVVAKGSSSARVQRIFGKDRIVVGERLLQESSDEQVIGVLGHEIGHVLKKHLYIKGLLSLANFVAFLAVIGEAGQSRPIIILAVTLLLSLELAEIPLNWRLEYAADKFAAEQLEANPVIAALEKLKTISFDGASLTHPPLSRRIRRIQVLSVPPLTIPVSA